jgi:RNA polymerase sigma-70 factor (ECF subfamily)
MSTPAHTDIDLLRRLRGGDGAALQDLYRRHRGPLYRFALLRCGSADTAADVIQEVFLGLLTDSFAYDPLRGQLANFLFGVARKLILKHEAPRQRMASLVRDDDEEALEEEVCDSAAGPLQRMLENEQAEAVRRALAQLAPHYRDCVILYELHDLSYLEIADICQVDIGTVRSRLARGRAALARKLRLTASDAA